MKNNKIMSNIFYNYFLFIFNMIYPLILASYLNRILKVENIGEISYIQSIINICIAISGLGIPLYGFAKISFETDKLKIKKIFSEIFILNIITSLIAFLTYNIYAYITNKNILYVLFSILIILNPFQITWYLNGIEEYKYIAIRNFIVKISILLSIFYFVKNSNDVNIYIYIICIGEIFNILYNIPVIKKNIILNIELKKLYKIILDLKYFFLRSLIAVCFNGVDQIIIGTSSSLDQIAYYSRARQIIAIGIMICTTFLSTISTRTNKKIDNNISYLKILSLSQEIIILFVFPIALGINVLAKELLYLIGGIKFCAGENILKILSIVIIITVFATYIDTQICIPNRRENITSVASILLLIVGGIVSIILVKSQGGLGLAIGLLCGETVGLIYQIIKIRENKFKWLFINKETINFIGASCLMWIVLFKIKKYFTLNIVNIFLLIILGITLYILSILFIDIVLYKKEKMNKLKELIKNV